MFKQKMKEKGLLRELDKIIYDPSFNTDIKTYKEIMSPIRFCKDNIKTKIFALHSAEQLLTREQEKYLFRKMNYTKFLAKTLLESDNLTDKQQKRIERLLIKSVKIKKQIVSSNVRLITKTVKKIVAKRNDRHNDFKMFVSDACISCMKAVECFDFNKGNKFSTYAVTAIKTNFCRIIPRENKIRDRFITGTGEDLSNLNFIEDNESSDRNKVINNTVKLLVNSLNSRRKYILEKRIFCETPTKFKDIAVDLCITSNNVRKLYTESLKSMRNMVLNGKVPLNSILKEFVSEN